MRIFTLLEDLNLPAFDAPAFHKFLRERIQNTGLLPFFISKMFLPSFSLRPSICPSKNKSFEDWHSDSIVHIPSSFLTNPATSVIFRGLISKQLLSIRDSNIFLAGKKKTDSFI
jgi:hypothetical protein